MSTIYPKRLIEVDLPIARISAHARREKSIRHGHISTLHIWWARRPLAACRAVICAALWPDPADPMCPPAFREAAIVALQAFARRVNPARISAEGRQLQDSLSEESRGRWESLSAGTLTLDPNEAVDMPILRMALLDFIADFANWDNSTVPAYLETSRLLTAIAHASLSDREYQLPNIDWSLPNAIENLQSKIKDLPRPLVVDPFCGGGSIPLEALRVGADAFASDLNPVPVLLNKVVLEYIPKYGKRLAEEVRKWGAWIKEEAAKELKEFYPKDPDGATPIAYLWARTIRCEGPACGKKVPLFKSTSLSTDGSKKWFFDITADEHGIKSQISSEQTGKVSLRGWAATCLDPNCNFTTPKARVQSQLNKQNGGADQSNLICVVTHRQDGNGKSFRAPGPSDYEAFESAVSRRLELGTEMAATHADLPGKQAHRAVGSQLPLYGFKKYAHLFTSRELVTLITLARVIRRVPSDNSELCNAVNVLLAFCLAKQADYLSSLCRWRSDGAYINPTLGGEKKYVMISDFVEGCPLSDGPGNWLTQIDWVSRVLDHEADVLSGSGQVVQSNAEIQILPSESSAAFITDPPYYDSVPYSDLSNFFYVWLRQAVVDQTRWGLTELVAPKVNEATVDHPRNPIEEANYQSRLKNAFHSQRASIQPCGIGVIVFAHKSTSGWESLLSAIIDAGWCITASWPVDTEMQNRLNAKGTASLVRLQR